MKNILHEINNFVEKFEPKFIDYFVLLSTPRKEVFPDNIEEIALFVYNDAFRTKNTFSSLDENFFENLYKNSFNISFLISKSMMFFLKNYIKEPDHKNLDEVIIHLENYEDNFEKILQEKCMINNKIMNIFEDDNDFIVNNILGIFKKIKEKKETITFFNLYDGVPISSKAVIINIHKDNEEVVFKYEKIQQIVMKAEGIAYILQDENFSKYIKADIMYQNFYDSTVTLKNFRYLFNMPASQREFVRVPPNLPAKVSLCEHKNMQTEGKLFDLSKNGLGVISETNNGLFVGAKVDMNFELYSYTKEVHDHIVTGGEILDIIIYEDSYRFCIQINPQGDIEKIIESYVQNREKEIMKNLNFRLLE